jgi:hypothetical protein
VIQVGIPPTLTVSSPVDGATYRAGDTITWNAFANDAAGFDLDDADITTVVRLHHGTLFHPFLESYFGPVVRSPYRSPVRRRPTRPTKSR